MNIYFASIPYAYKNLVKYYGVKWKSNFRKYEKVGIAI